MQKVTCLYDLAQEVEYSQEDMDVFGIVWNRHSEDTLASKIIVQTADSILLVSKPTKLQLRTQKIIRTLAIAAAIILAFSIVFLAILAASNPDRFSFWGLTVCLTGFGAAVGLIDFMYGGK